VSELNKLLKMHRQMADVMKKMGKGGMLKQAMKGMFGKGGGDMEQMKQQLADPEAMKAAQAAMSRGGGLPGMPGMGGGLPGGLSGLGLGKKR